MDVDLHVQLNFDNVMVMVDDQYLRDNRLALLEKILSPFKKFLDFSRILE